MYGDEQSQHDAFFQNAERVQLALKAARVAAWEFDARTGTLQYAGNIGPPSHSILSTRDVAGSQIDEQQLTQELITPVAVGSGTYSSEFRLMGPDGNVLWVRNQGETVYDADGRARHVIGVTLDITERKEAEELVRTISAG